MWTKDFCMDALADLSEDIYWAINHEGVLPNNEIGSGTLRVTMEYIPAPAPTPQQQAEQAGCDKYHALKEDGLI